MIAPIDGSDPPEPPLTPVSFDFQNQSIRVKASRGCVLRLCAAYATAVSKCDTATMAMNRAMAISGAIAMSGAMVMSRGHGHE